MHTLELCKVFSGAKTATADDYISFSEFRMICVYITICAAIYDIFTMQSEFPKTMILESALTNS